MNITDITNLSLASIAAALAADALRRALADAALASLRPVTVKPSRK